MQAFAIEELQNKGSYHENNDSRSSQIHNEIHKAETYSRTNHNIWWIPYQCGSTANVGSQNLSHQEWLYIYLQLGSDAKGNGYSQQYSGNIVQQGRADSSKSC